MDNNNQNKPNYNIHPDLAVGVYSNLALIAHSKSDFVIDFGVTLPALDKPEVVSRIILTPEHAKRLFLALQENVGKYEQQFGVINLGQGETKPFNPFGPKGLS